MINRMLWCLLSVSIVINSNFAASRAQDEEFVEIDLKAYFDKHPGARTVFEQSVKHSRNAAWNVAMNTIAHDTLLTAGISGVGVAAMAAAACCIEGKNQKETLTTILAGSILGSITVGLPIGFSIGAIRGGYKAYQELQHRRDGDENLTRKPLNAIISVGASYTIACGLGSVLIGKSLGEKLELRKLAHGTNFERYIIGATCNGLLIAALGGSYWLYTTFYASNSEEERIQNNEAASEDVQAARTLAHEYTRTHKMSTMFYPYSHIDNLY